MKPIPTLLASASLLLAACGGSAAAPPVGPVAAAVICASNCITEFDIPSAGGVRAGAPGPTEGASIPHGLVVGRDGAIWFHEGPSGKIGRITTAGKITEFPIPSPWTAPMAQGFVAAGSDGAVWFTAGPAAVGRITMAGSLATFALPAPMSLPYGFAAGPDGAMWFTESARNRLGRITSDGTITEFPLTDPRAGAIGIAAGSDRALWFLEKAAQPGPAGAGFAPTVGRAAVDGTISEFKVAVTAGQPHSLLRIVEAADGALWFTDLGGQVGRITTAGAVTLYPVPDGFTPVGITPGPGRERALYVAGFKSNTILRLDLSGTVTNTWTVPTPGSVPYHLVAGPDGAIWFTEHDANKIGRLRLTGT